MHDPSASNLDTAFPHDVCCKGALKALSSALALLGCHRRWWAGAARNENPRSPQEVAEAGRLLMQKSCGHRNTNAALQQASAAADSPNARRSAMSSGLSHELRTRAQHPRYAHLLLQRPTNAPSPARSAADHIAAASGLLALSMVLDVRAIRGGGKLS